MLYNIQCEIYVQENYFKLFISFSQHVSDGRKRRKIINLRMNFCTFSLTVSFEYMRINYSHSTILVARILRKYEKLKI